MSITVEKLGTRRATVRVLHTWHEVYASTLTQSDPRKLIGCVEDAIRAFERRYSEWGTHPGTPTELATIQKCISALHRLMKKHMADTGQSIKQRQGRAQRRRSAH